MATITTAARTISSYNAWPGSAFGARWREARRGGSPALRSAGTGEVALIALARGELARERMSVPARDWRGAVRAAPAKAGSSQVSLVLAAAVFVFVATRR